MWKTQGRVLINRYEPQYVWCEYQHPNMSFTPGYIYKVLDEKQGFIQVEDKYGHKVWSLKDNWIFI